MRFWLLSIGFRVCWGRYGFLVGVSFCLGLVLLECYIVRFRYFLSFRNIGAGLVGRISRFVGWLVLEVVYVVLYLGQLGCRWYFCKFIVGVGIFVVLDLLVFFYFRLEGLAWGFVLYFSFLVDFFFGFFVKRGFVFESVRLV